MQTLIVILIIGIVTFFSLRKVIRIIKGKETSCNCGGNCCNCNKKEK